MLIVDDDTGENDRNFGSYKNGKLLVRLSVGITVIVLLFWLSTKESVIIVSQLTLITSIELVIFGSLLPYFVCMIKFGSKLISSPNFEPLKSS